MIGALVQFHPSLPGPLGGRQVDLRLERRTRLIDVVYVLFTLFPDFMSEWPDRADPLTLPGRIEAVVNGKPAHLDQFTVDTDHMELRARRPLP